MLTIAKNKVNVNVLAWRLRRFVVNPRVKFLDLECAAVSDGRLVKKEEIPKYIKYKIAIGLSTRNIFSWYLIINSIPKIEYRQWKNSLVAIPKAVKIDALLEDDSDCLSTTAKSGPGLITATRWMEAIKRNSVKISEVLFLN